MSLIVGARSRPVAGIVRRIGRIRLARQPLHLRSQSALFFGRALAARQSMESTFTRSSGNPLSSSRRRQASVNPAGPAT